MDQKYNQNGSDEINLTEYIVVIKRYKKQLCYFIAAAVLLTILISIFMPKYYKATAVIMPISKSAGGNGLATMVGQFSGLASLAGMGGVVGGQTPSQQFMALLKTRTLAEDIIQKFDLIPVLLGKHDLKDQGVLEEAIKKLRKCTSFLDDKKGGTISISAEFKDPKLATDVANGYVEGLQKFVNNNSFTVAKRNRVFIENQLEQNKIELLEAGKALNEFYKGGKISSVDAKVDVPLDGHVNIEDNLQKLNKKKEELESKMVKDVPQQVYLQYLTLKRSLLTQINSLLTQQYEMAKIEEAKDELAFQVIDPARIPVKKSRPKRVQIIIVSFISSLFASVFIAFFLEYLRKTKGKYEEK